MRMRGEYGLPAPAQKEWVVLRGRATLLPYECERCTVSPHYDIQHTKAYAHKIFQFHVFHVHAPEE